MNNTFNENTVIANIDDTIITANDVLTAFKNNDSEKINEYISYAVDTDAVIDSICDNVLAYAYGTYVFTDEIKMILNDAAVNAYYEALASYSDDAVQDIINAYVDTMNVVIRASKALGKELTPAEALISLEA